ncbi:hypothetical protein GN958_ATG16716 [Phytophthora infestans]|uniref:Uncharacterized protein n=1 Tax=Phytophthora infestans TaxID=4787 RepID=A0A8S9U588_PHYIN|nr:hypothetical protein GN958_ATG16716 [Phytophthora infestans]
MVGSGASRDRSPLLRYGSGRSDSDDIELLALSRHSKVASDRGNLVRLPLRTVFYALNGVALFVLLSLCISMHNTISRLESPTVVTVPKAMSYGRRLRILCSQYDGLGRPHDCHVSVGILGGATQEVKENDTDRCGFYFIPHVALRRWIAQFQDFFVNSFDIQWDSQSYAANKDAHPDLDYTLLESSTKTQNHSESLGPFPYAKIVQHFQ